MQRIEQNCTVGLAGADRIADNRIHQVDACQFKRIAIQRNTPDHARLVAQEPQFTRHQGLDAERPVKCHIGKTKCSFQCSLGGGSRDLVARAILPKGHIVQRLRHNIRVQHTQIVCQHFARISAHRDRTFGQNRRVFDIGRGANRGFIAQIA